MSTLDATIRFCGLFEAELLTQLMLTHWGHPCADDNETVNLLLESASEILMRSKGGECFFQDVIPEHMNFVAAIWYVEQRHVEDSPEADNNARMEWLEKVKRALPSCFCDPNNLM